MSAVNPRPFLVSSGGQRRRSSNNNRHEAGTPPSGRRTFTAGPQGTFAAGPQGRRTSTAAAPPGRRTSSARNTPNPARVRTNASALALNFGAIPEAAVNADVAGGVTTSSPGPKITVVRPPAAGNAASRRRPSVIKSASRRGSTMKGLLLEQQTQHQQPRVEPMAENSISIQAERQQRRKRGLLHGLPGDFFGARDKTAQDLFRGVPTLPGHALCTDRGSDGNKLWTGSTSVEQDFLLSCPVSKVDWFVSHTWARDRRDQMFRNTVEFTGFKAIELGNLVEDIASEKREKRRESGVVSKLDEMLMKDPTEPLVLWIDKFCVSPDILERRLVVEKHMEHFLTNSDGFLALLSPNYFQRLWCVYEWGCFVETHGVSTLDRIRVCLSWLCSSPTFQVPLVAHDLETLSVSRLKCSELNDQLFLRSTITSKFTSLQAFERMVQVSALCSLAKSCAVLALDFITAGHPELEEAWGVFNRHILWRHNKFLLPWKTVAAKLGLPDVYAGLNGFWAQMQRSTKMSAEGGKVDDGSDQFCVSAPPRSRLRVIANSAAQMHLAVLVRKTRSAAMGAEGLAAVAMMSLSAMAKASKNGSSGAGTSPSGGAVLEGGDEEDGSGSESSGSEDDARDARFSSFASEAAW